jgi:hypothetical protein
MKILPTSRKAKIEYSSGGRFLAPNHIDPGTYVDVSLQSPDQQFATLVSIVQADDDANPAPYTGTPPWGESIDPADYIPESTLQSEYRPAPNFEVAPTADDMLSLVSDAYGPEIPEWVWFNDPQYHGLGVPPGVPNWGQPYETGHTQINLPNPAASYREFEWSGKPVARVSRHENAFDGYMAGQQRGHGVSPIKLYMPYVLRTQQMRDMLLKELKRRGVHNVVVSDVPSLSYTEQVQVTDPTILAPQAPIGAEGVLP